MMTLFDVSVLIVVLGLLGLALVYAVYGVVREAGMDPGVNGRPHDED